MFDSMKDDIARNGLVSNILKRLADFEIFMRTHGSIDHPSGAANPWTPTIVGVTTIGVGTYAVQSGTHSKIGDMVFIRAYISWTAHTGTGNMRIGGLPFTPSTVSNVFQPMAVWFSNLTLAAVGNKVQVFASPTFSDLAIQEVGGGASTPLAVEAAGDIMISGFYFVD
jgi:hypothetical protein